MKKSVILIYLTDAWHTRASMELIGVATTEKYRDKIIREFLRDHLETKPSRDDITSAVQEVRENGQTQSLFNSHDVEIYTEVVDTNVVSY